MKKKTKKKKPQRYVEERDYIKEKVLRKKRLI